MTAGPDIAQAKVREAPVFSPTEAEWSDPIEYIQSIRPKAEKAGICKIIPPRTFRPPFAVDKSTFRFRTRVQTLCKLDAVARIEREFMLALRLRLYQDGTPMGIDPLPMAPAQLKGHIEPLRLYRLYRAVEELGGPVKVTSRNLWAQLSSKMFGDEFGGDLALQKSLKTAYERYLLNYVLDLHSNNSSDKENKNTFTDCSNFDFDSIMSLALEGIASAQKGTVCGETSLQTAKAAEEKAEKITNNFKFEENGRKRRKIESTTRIKMKTSLRKPELPKVRVGATFWKYFDDKEQAYSGRVKQRRGGRSDDDPNASWEIFFRGNGNDRGFAQVIDNDAVVMLIASGETAELAKFAFEEGICQQCYRASDPECLLICDGCNFAYHTYCLNPPLINVPRGDWFCPVCLDDEDDEEDEEEEGNDGSSFHNYETPIEKSRRSLEEKKRNKQLASFGFGDGDHFNLDEYKVFADRFKQKYLAKVKAANPKADPRLFLNPQTADAKKKHAVALEDEYWRLISNYARLSDDSELLSLTVSYGSDLDTGELGSGFPTAKSVARLREKVMKMESEIMNRKWGKDYVEEYARLKSDLEKHERYAKSGWNINNLPTLSGSLLQYVDSNITGVMVPWLYAGMCFSSFCWHTEDHYFASINYHHFGAPKTWYGVPGTGATKFEQAARKIAPELFSARRDLLTGIVTQFNPHELSALGAPIYHCIQHEGEFVITFPRGYHGGFNHGFNCAEAVNFAMPDWIKFGDQCVKRYSSLRKPPVISHEALLCSLVSTITNTSKGDASELAKYLLPSIDNMISYESRWRKKLRKAFKAKTIHSYPGDTSYQTVKANLSPRAGSMMKRRLPGQNNNKQENKNITVEGRERPSIMGRMSGMSKAYKSLIQCEFCKRYCPLSFVWLNEKHQGYCLEHGLSHASNPNSVLVIVFKDDELRTIRNKLTSFVM